MRKGGKAIVEITGKDKWKDRCAKLAEIVGFLEVRAFKVNCNGTVFEHGDICAGSKLFYLALKETPGAEPECLLFYTNWNGAKLEGLTAMSVFSSNPRRGENWWEQSLRKIENHLFKDLVGDIKRWSAPSPHSFNHDWWKERAACANPARWKWAYIEASEVEKVDNFVKGTAKTLDDVDTAAAA